MAYEMLQADAFTSHPLEGNACAVLPEAEGLDAATMQRIARENNLSETSFVFRGGKADFTVRYFTPTSELPMAGHPTIATAHVLRETGRLPQGATSLTLEMKAGIVPVRIEQHHESTRYVMRQMAPTFMRTYTREACATALGLGVDEILGNFIPQTVSTGAAQLMIPLRDPAMLAKVRPNLPLLFPEKSDNDYFSVHVFAPDEGEVALRSRHYVDFNGIVEDPFTGSATGGMAAYCARYGVITKVDYAVAQGQHVGRPGTGYVRVIGKPDAIEGIEVGGEAVTVLRGTLLL